MSAPSTSSLSVELLSLVVDVKYGSFKWPLPLKFDFLDKWYVNKCL